MMFHPDSLGLLRTMPDESVDAIITDPMYGTAEGDDEEPEGTANGKD